VNENYAYPLDYTWTTEEITIVFSFFKQVENYYENKRDNQEFLKAYQKFKTVVPSKMQEKQIGKEFEQNSGYSIYEALQSVKSVNNT